MERDFTTLDLYLAAFLDFRGLPPNLCASASGKVTFSFPVSEKLYDLLSKFNSGANVPAADYVQRIKILKGRMIDKKQEVLSNGK